jgi:hypothetical protein
MQTPKVLATLVLAVLPVFAFTPGPAFASTIGLNTGEAMEIFAFTSSGGNVDRGLVHVNAGGGHSADLGSRKMKAWASAALSGQSRATAFMSTEFNVARGLANQTGGTLRIELTGINVRGNLSAAGISTALYELKLSVSKTPAVPGNPSEEVVIARNSATGLREKRIAISNAAGHVDITVVAGYTYTVRVELLTAATGSGLASTAISDFGGHPHLDTDDTRKVTVGAIQVRVLQATVPRTGPGRYK